MVGVLDGSLFVFLCRICTDKKRIDVENFGFWIDREGEDVDV